ncbi:UNVERIFIED_CONTAM: hypothetical protein PYX00_002792 [Menopon gallinae]|uniref:Uncharacterized protein n=1 Tax=Menopon gallinae TaxID=328185 RepID=A0AAW2HXT8_9NEOP
MSNSAVCCIVRYGYLSINTRRHYFLEDYLEDGRCSPPARTVGASLPRTRTSSSSSDGRNRQSSAEWTSTINHPPSAMAPEINQPPSAGRLGSVELRNKKYRTFLRFRQRY